MKTSSASLSPSFPLLLLLVSSLLPACVCSQRLHLDPVIDVASLISGPSHEEQHQHLQVQSAAPSAPTASSSAPEGTPSHMLFLELLSQGTDAIHRKIDLLTDVQDSVHELFDSVLSRRRDGLPGELFNQLKLRCVEKIFNLKFLLQTVDRLVHERLHMERMSDVFSTLASKRTNDSQLLVTQIHRNAAELAESIRSDLGRAIEQVDGLTGGGLFGLGLGLGSSSSPLLSFASLMDKISLLQKFRLQSDKES